MGLRHLCSREFQLFISPFIILAHKDHRKHIFRIILGVVYVLMCIILIYSKGKTSSVKVKGGGQSQIQHQSQWQCQSYKHNLNTSSRSYYNFFHLLHLPLYNLRILHFNYQLLAFVLGSVFNILFISIYLVSLS